MQHKTVHNKRYVTIAHTVPLISTGVEVRLVILLGAKSREISLNGSTVVETAL